MLPIVIDALKSLLISTANDIKGALRRLFMARTVKAMGPGGQRQAERELGWDRTTIRKGMHELDSGMTCLDNFAARGRKRAEHKLPNLLSDIKAVVDGQSQTDPQFKTNRLYTRLSAAEVRRQLITVKHYTDEQLPVDRTIARKLDDLGYRPSRVQKTKPKKKIPQTDAIFEQLKRIHAEADRDPSVLRLSLDAKAPVKLGPFSRGGKSRVKVRACDHDFPTQQKLTPWGLLLPKFDELFLYLTASKVTSDFIMDTLERWWLDNKSRFPEVKTLLLNQDNGPENSVIDKRFKRVADVGQLIPLPTIARS
jgi:hypothetical protein